MGMDDSEQRDISSVAEDNLLCTIVDDLYILKHYLLKDGKLAPDALQHLNSIGNIILDFPELNKNLYEWNFLENEVLYFLRSSGFNQAIEIATRVLTIVNKAPNLYFTKKFLFFITEKLYSAMGGRKASMRGITVLEDGENPHKDEPSHQLRINDTIRLIMLFAKRLIEINREVVIIMNDLMFFELANACACIETAQMLNAVFVGVSFFENITIDEPAADWKADGIYEIRRTYFDPEVIFRDKSIFDPIVPVENLKGGVLKQIYDQCTNLFDFADLSFKDTVDILLYKRTVYMSGELEVFLLEAKDPKAIKFYRRSLEAGGVCAGTYLNSMIKAVDDQKTCMDACVILYYIRDFIVNFKSFTEARLRSIVENLEYRCGSECEKVVNCEQKVVTKMTKGAQNKTEALSIDGNFYSDVIFAETGQVGPSPVQETDEKPLKSVLEDFSEFDNGEEFEAKGLECVTTTYCDQYRILKLIQHIYPHVNRRFLFKPSYLILFRSSFEHVPEMRSFILEFLGDFIVFLKLDRLNIARVFVPVNQKRLKMIEIKLEEGDECIVEQTPYTMIETDVKSTNAPQVKVTRGVIESDEEI